MVIHINGQLVEGAILAKAMCTVEAVRTAEWSPRILPARSQPRHRTLITRYPPTHKSCHCWALFVRMRTMSWQANDRLTAKQSERRGET